MYSVQSTGRREAYDYEAVYGGREENESRPAKNSRETQEAEDEQKRIEEFKARMEAIKDAFEPCLKRNNSYDATADLIAIANAESEPALKAIYTRLLLEARLMKGSGEESGETKASLTKIKKVIGKVKTKIKKLKKESQLEKKAESARKAKQRRLEEAVRRELALRRKVRKDREQKDIEESRMGMGANYGGPVAGSSPINEIMTGIMTETAVPIAGEAEEAAMMDTGGVVTGGSIDIAL